MKTIVITGASSGIGRATAELFAAKGWNVAATMRRPKDEHDLQNLPGVRLYRMDVTDPTSINAARDAVLTDCETVDVVLNNAGYALIGPLELSAEEQIRRVYDTLLFGPTLVAKAFIPHLREKQSGVIIGVSSVGGVLTLPLTPTYHAAKYGLEGLMEGLSHELLPFGVLCKLIEPGGIATDFWGRSMVLASGIEESAYADTAGPFLASMNKLAERRASPKDVAEIIFEASTDGKRRWRYTVASEEFIAFRRTMNDEEWLAWVEGMYRSQPAA